MKFNPSSSSAKTKRTRLSKQPSFIAPEGPVLVLARYIGPSRAIAFLIWILGAPARATHADPSGAKLLAAQFTSAFSASLRFKLPLHNLFGFTNKVPLSKYAATFRPIRNGCDPLRKQVQNRLAFVCNGKRSQRRRHRFLFQIDS